MSSTPARDQAFSEPYVHLLNIRESPQLLIVSAQVHISDLTALYVLILQKALADSSSFSHSSPFARYYIASVENIPWKWSATIFGEVMHKHGLIDSKEPKSLKAEEAGFLGL